MQNDNELAQSQFKLAAILDSINHDIILLDEENRVRYINLRGKSHIFSEIRPVVGQPFKEALEELIKKYEIDNSDRLYQLYQEVSEPGKFLTSTTKISLTKSMKKYYVVTTSPIYDEKLGHMGRIWQFEDITTEENLDQMKSEFISIASHQLRTPLTSIRGYVDMMLEGDYGDVPSYLKEPLDAIFKSSNQMAELVGDLLNLSRLERGTEVMKIDRVDVADLIKEVQELFEQKLITKNQKLNVKFESTDNTVITSDKAKLRECLKNLIENAIKYSPAGTQIDFSVTEDDQYLKLFVKDHGVGIPKNQQGKIFQKFFRAANVLTENFEGTGLGLYYVKKVIEQLDGKIEFQSEENKGTTFEIDLPINDQTFSS